MCHMLCDQPDEALRDAMQAQCVYPDWPTAFYLQAVALAKLNMLQDSANMLKEAAILEDKRLICTRRTKATCLYRCGSLRSFAGAGEIIKNNKETEKESKLKDAVLSAHSAKFDAERCISDHERLVRDLGLRMTSLEKAMEGKDTPQILAAVKELEETLNSNNLSSSSSRNKNTFPTELTAMLLQRFGGNLRALQLKTMMKELVVSHHVSDEMANLVLARSIVVTAVLSFLFFSY
ncbi:unnamed protein product [Microthlaspi erraticum]|uniref:Serine/threonine-protein kinase BSK n=1 Tax=Microthlaspi erraticum TaxID=1685480 RepID=A0A6D2I5W5_9BRAS|nr:unnamed protein product [Microthlaspi erraticum]